MNDGQNREPLSLDVQFKNLGKINEANIRLRPFTVIAGCNGSGKSFVTRTLYSMFNTSIHEESFSQISKYYSSALEAFKFFEDNFDLSSNELINFTNLKKSFKDAFDINENREALEVLRSAASNKAISICNEVCRTFDSIKFKPKDNPKLAEDWLISSEKASEILHEASDNRKEMIKLCCSSLKLAIENPEDFLDAILSSEFSEKISDNFMVSNPQEIIRHGRKFLGISLDNTNEITISKVEVLFRKSTFEKIKKIGLGSSLYLESPIYWKLTPALKASQKILNETAKKRRLGEGQLVRQVPRYFFDLIELLEVQVKTNHFDDIIQTIEQAINGNLSFSDGNIQFSDNTNNSTVGLNLTALGVTNLGMIALLLKRGAILPGTFLFIDEPEVHLHPSWQIIFIQVLHELSKRGVNVVIASHSIDIMKAIENIMDSDDDIDPQTHFGINQLTKDGNSVDDSENNFKRLAAIKKDLGTPFYEMFLDQRA